MSTSTSQATVIKRGRKFQVQVDGKDVGKATTKAKADTEAARLNGGNGTDSPTPTEAASAQEVGAAVNESLTANPPTPPTQVGVDGVVVAETRHEDITPAAKTPAEQASAKLEGLDAKAAEAEIKKWQGLLEDARKSNSPEAKAAVGSLETMIAVGDQHMSSLEDGGKPQSAAAKRAAKAAETRAAKEASAAAQAATTEEERATTASGRAAPRPSTIGKDGEMKCTGLKGKTEGCGETKSVTKFPTKSATERSPECRDCRDKRLAAAKTA